MNVRSGSPEDAAGIVAIWTAIVSEKVHSAVDRPFTVQGQREYLEGLSDRERLSIAESPDGRIVGFQSLDLWTKLFHSTDHVGQLGTFVLPQWRGCGVGTRLAQRTLAFAREVRYHKLVVFVRGSNMAAQAFYGRLGFAPCGRLVRQVRIGDGWDDEVVMEMFL